MFVSSSLIPGSSLKLRLDGLGAQSGSFGLELELKLEPGGRSRAELPQLGDDAQNW